MIENMWLRHGKERLLNILFAAMLLVTLAACGGEVQEDYYDDDTGSPEQGAPLDAGDQEIEDFEEDSEDS
jgi:hypothetical protein